MAKVRRRASALWLALLLPGSAWATVQNTRTSQTYPTVSAAIADAAVGDTLAVGPGVYVEQIIVDRSLTIVGAGSAPGPNQVTLQWDAVGSSVVTVNPGIGLELRDVRLASDGSSRGVFADNAAGLTLTGVWVDGTNTGSSGGGIRIDDTPSTLTDVVVSGTGAGGGGGGVSITALTSVPATFTNVQVSGATASGAGGGISASNIDLSCAPCIIDGNAAGNHGGGLYGVNGSLISVDGSYSGNLATGDGGGVYWSGGLVDLSGDALDNNDAANGGGLALDGVDASLADLHLAHNTATGRGGAIDALNPTAFTFTRGLVCRSTSPLASAVDLDTVAPSILRDVRFVENSSQSALRVQGGTTASLDNNAYLGNDASVAALWLNGGSTATIRNNLIGWTATGFGAQVSGSATVDYNWFLSNALGPITGALLGGNATVGLDPELKLYTPNGDCDDDNLVPTWASPLIDGGDPTIFDPDGFRSDVGAYGGPSADVRLHRDLDFDGFTAVRECDDTEPAMHPDGEEVCDGLDNDCDTDIDEGATDADDWYLDLDGDGQGNAATQVLACTMPAPGPWTRNFTDCDDTEPTVFLGAPEDCSSTDRNCDALPYFGAPGSLLYPDVDGDGYGDDLLVVQACANEYPGYIQTGGDCDDGQALVHPNQDEQLCDGIDQNCANGEEDAPGVRWFYPDLDGDGHGDGTLGGLASCEDPTTGQWAEDDASDCNDGDPLVNPSAPERCDGLDTNCNGFVDDGDPLATWWPDGDGDTYGDDASPVSSFCAPDPSWVQQGGDCDDTLAEVYTGAAEVCDELDNDCDDLVDTADDDAVGLLEGYEDFDGDGFGTGASMRVCDLTGLAVNADDCHDGNAEIHPDADEIPDNDVDEDCDGVNEQTGTDGPPGDEPDGCGCSQGGAAGVGWVWVLALAIRRRR